MLGSLTDPQGLLDEAGGSLLGSIASTEGPPSQWNTPVVTQEGVPPAHPLDTIRQKKNQRACAHAHRVVRYSGAITKTTNPLVF